MITLFLLLFLMIYKLSKYTKSLYIQDHTLFHRNRYTNLQWLITEIPIEFSKNITEIDYLCKI